MSDIERSQLWEVLNAADTSRNEAILAQIAESEVSDPGDWTDVIVDEAVRLDKRMRFLGRYGMLPNFILGTNVPVRSRGRTEYEDASWYSPLLFETEAEFLGNNYAVSTGLTVSSYSQHSSSWQRSVRVNRWLINTAPDDSKTKSRPERLAEVSFNHRLGNVDVKGAVGGKEFAEFAWDWRQIGYKQAEEAGERPDYHKASEDIIYPQAFYVSALGLLRACNKVLNKKVSGPTGTVSVLDT